MYIVVCCQYMLCYNNYTDREMSLCITFFQDLMNEKGATYLFNRVNLQIFYHKGTNEGTKKLDGRILRAMIQLKSCEKSDCAKPLSLPKDMKAYTDQKPFSVTYTYTVEFIVSHVCIRFHANYLNQPLHNYVCMIIQSSCQPPCTCRRNRTFVGPLVGTTS